MGAAVAALRAGGTSSDGGVGIDWDDYLFGKDGIDSNGLQVWRRLVGTNKCETLHGLMQDWAVGNNMTLELGIPRCRLGITRFNVNRRRDRGTEQKTGEYDWKGRAEANRSFEMPSMEGIFEPPFKVRADGPTLALLAKRVAEEMQSGDLGAQSASNAAVASSVVRSDRRSAGFLGVAKEKRDAKACPYPCLCNQAARSGPGRRHHTGDCPVTRYVKEKRREMNPLTLCELCVLRMLNRVYCVYCVYCVLQTVLHYTHTQLT